MSAPPGTPAGAPLGDPALGQAAQLCWAINQIHALVATVDTLQEKVAALELYVKKLEEEFEEEGRLLTRLEVGGDLKGEDSSSEDEKFEVDDAD